MADVVRDRFFYGGKVQEIGDEIEVKNEADRRVLTERGLIGAAKAKPAPENKALKAPDNKSAKPKG